ncbi:MAG: S41 family peptidase [Cyclobacteriaceae bacterium]
MKKSALVIIPVIMLALLAFKPIGENDRYFQIVKNLDIFATLFKEVNSYYVDEINPTQLIKTGIDAMLESLDPYTDYIPEDDIEDYMTMTTGEYGGIGALVDNKDGFNTVIMPYEGSPAHKAGLQIGDQILKINGIDLTGKNAGDISKLLKGQSDSDLMLEVKRFKQDELLNISLKREKITIKNVPYYGMAAEGVGYIKLTDFTTKAGKEVGSALKKLKSEGAEKVILDLRGNPGGLLDEAIKVSNVFVPKNKEVVSTKGKLEDWSKKYLTPAEPVDINIPVAVLTDNGSASASEIVAGVIQDYDRGVLVGRKTFGKGLVQQTRPLAYNSQLKVTTAKYYIPSGRCIQAIDYSRRNSDGSVGKIPDSLKTEFRTANNRMVYDGGGVDPDVVVVRSKPAPIARNLFSKDLIFHFATEFHHQNKDIGSAKKFTLTDDQYTQFVDWLDGKDYGYTTGVDKKISELIAESKKEKTYELMKPQIDALMAAAQDNKESDIEIFKADIKRFLEQEIASRYYLQNGIIESSFKYDQDVLQAVSVLNDTERYQSILKGSN